MSDYSRNNLRKASRLLRDSISYEEWLAAGDEVSEAFRIAHNWRDSFQPVIRAVRQELMAAGRRTTRSSTAGLTAGRIKRMSSIRRKLRPGMSLDSMQDVGGCRIIVPNQAGVEVLTADYISGNRRYEVTTQSNYVENPKPDGYRSVHLVLKVDDVGPFWRPVEIQLRSRAQHAWATAVEAVGLVRKENLKFGDGCPNWLRLFVLMSGEIAEEESSPIPNSCPSSSSERRSELVELERELSAAARLESYRRLIDQGGGVVPEMKSGRFYEMSFDIDRGGVQIENLSLDPERMQKHLSSDPVYVDVERAEDLKRAFPNYFLDVESFTKRLVSATRPASKPVVTRDATTKGKMLLPRRYKRFGQPRPD